MGVQILASDYPLEANRSRKQQSKTEQKDHSNQFHT